VRKGRPAHKHQERHRTFPELSEQRMFLRE